MNHLDKEKQVVSRRAVLKAFTATGSATILSTLPAKWERPVVKVGALPAVAAVSPAPTLTPTATPTPTLAVAPTMTFISGMATQAMISALLRLLGLGGFMC